MYFIHYSCATNTKGMWEGASKQPPDLKILPRRDRAPPPLRFEIPGSATGHGELNKTERITVSGNEKRRVDWLSWIIDCREKYHSCQW